MDYMVGAKGLAKGISAMLGHLCASKCSNTEAVLVWACTIMAQTLQTVSHSCVRMECVVEVDVAPIVPSIAMAISWKTRSTFAKAAAVKT
jgi:hypothetical protein